MTAVSILGAGPYGLATAAHLKAAGIRVNVFGDPMSFWARTMPAGMLLRSPYVASSISDPRRELDLAGYTRTTGVAVGSPVPLTTFVEYGQWFQATAVPEVDRRAVTRVRRSHGHFVLTLADGDEVSTDRVVVAAGIADFAHVPEPFRDLPAELVSHLCGHTDLGRFAGRRVLVVGCGQSALESVALLSEGGADVQLAARAEAVRWLNQRPWLRSLGPLTRLLYAPPEVGPPLLSQLVRFPGAVGRLPARSRGALDRRSVRPAGAGWLKARVDGVVRLRHECAVDTAGESPDGGVAVTFHDGTRERFDQVLLGTGYRVDVARHRFLDRDLLADVRRVGGYPVLGRGFESSVPGLHFVGATGAWTFGPLLRFVAGTPFAAAEVARRLASSARAKARRPARAAVVRT